MRLGKIVIAILTLLLGVLGLSAEFLPRDDSLVVCVTSSSGEEETIQPWLDYWGDAYFFLPGYADLSSAQIRIGRDGKYLLDGREVENGTLCADFSLNTAYVLTTASEEEAFANTITFVRSGGVNTLFVDLKSGSTDDIFQDKNHKEVSRLRAYGSDGALNVNASDVWVNGRGNSTWENEKKPLNLEFNLDTAFLGMEPAKKWALLANVSDPSNLKNKLVMDFAIQVGMPYSPDSRYVDLYLNGEYAGLYLLCERNEVHPNRINLSGEGSFLVYKDGIKRFQAANKPYILTQDNVALEICYAETDERTLLNHWQSVENAILAEDGTDPVSGKHWTDLIDLESWAMKYLLEETFGNTDAITYSQYFYYDSAEADPKIHAGPVWDYDLSMLDMPEDACPLYLCKPDIYSSSWYPALYGNDMFYACLTEYYETRIRPALQTVLDESLNATAMQIETACKMNDIRWYRDSTNAAETVRTNLQKRMALLDKFWLEDTVSHLVVMRGYEYDVRCFAVETGGRLPQCPSYPNTPNVSFDGWYYTDTDEPVDMERPVTEDIEIYLKYEVLEAQPDAEEAYEEPLTMIRILPLLLFLGMFAVVSGIGMLQLRRETRNRERVK